MQLEVIFTLEHGSHSLEYMRIAFISLKYSENMDQRPIEYKIK
jgi:hypothetical protein